VNDKIIPIGKRNPNLPFHPAVRAGDFIYVSGQVAKDENGNMSSATSRRRRAGPSRASAAFAARRRGLERRGQVTVYLDDARNFGRYNKIFAEYFPDGRVSRTTVEAAR